MAHVYKSIVRLSRTTSHFGRVSQNNLSTFSKINSLQHIPDMVVISTPNRKRTRCTNISIQNRSYCLHRPDAFGLSNDIEPVFNEIIGADYSDDQNILNKLYPDSNDVITSTLKRCSSIQQVFDVIQEHSCHLETEHLCQSVLVLSNMQKKYYESFIENLLKYDLKSSPENMTIEYNERLKSNLEFQHLLQLIQDRCSTFTFDEISYSLVCLKQMGLQRSDNVVEDLLTHAHQKINNCTENCNLKSLAMYSRFLETKDSLIYCILSKDITPRVLQYLDNCQSVTDFEYITLCLHNMHNLVTRSTLDIYKYKGKELIDSNVITNEDYKMLLKIINFLNLPHWSNVNSSYIVFVCQLIKNSIEKMDAHEIIYLHKVFHSHLEPAAIIPHIHEKATQLLEQMKHDDRVKIYQLIPDLLFCQITASLPHKVLIYKNITSEILKTLFPSTILSIYRILRYLKVSNMNLCNEFWKLSYENIMETGADYQKILQMSHKYMYFNNNFDEYYKNNMWEQNMINCHLKMIENSDASFLPWKFCRSLAFIMAYGFPKPLVDSDTMNELVNKLEGMHMQLDVFDCLILSRGFQISTNSKKYLCHAGKQNLMRVNCILEQCTERLLNTHTQIFDINIIFKSMLNRRVRFDTDQFHLLVGKYTSAEGNLSSRTVRDSSFNFLTCSTIVPSFVDRLIDYIALNNDNILGETAQKVLNLCYHSGYVPKNDDFFHAAVNVIYRDKELMNGLSLLCSCQALCFFGYLTDKLIHYVFSIEFMERLDAEIASCYSKRIYPARIRRQLMLLNRAVCLELPQHNVPWFHQKYVQEIISLTPKNKSHFHNDVLDTLIAAVGKKEVIKYPHFAPYGYKIDFLINRDKNGVFIPASHIPNDEIVYKIAVLLHTKDIYFKIHRDETEGYSLVLHKKGTILTMHRHLEQMGYKVIEISISQWNSMHMAEPDAKINYIKNQIRNL